MKYYKYKRGLGTVNGPDIEFFKFDEDASRIWTWHKEQHNWIGAHFSWVMWAKKNAEEVTEQEVFIEIL